MAKMRSPNYPAIGLSEAEKLIRMLWDKEKRTVVTSAVIARAWSYNSVSGPVRTKIAALRKYGLLEQVRDGFRLSDLAMHILHGQPNSNELCDALVQAALRPEMFKELRSTHLEASDDNLMSHLLIKKGFSEAGARQFIKAFRETMHVAEQASGGNIPLEQKESSVEESMESLSDSTLKKRSAAPPPFVTSAKPTTHAVYTWPLSKDVTAEVRVNGGELVPEQIDRLIAYLNLAKAALDNSDK